MSLLDSDGLLDLLVEQNLIAAKQRQFVILQKGKQRQKLLKMYGGKNSSGRGNLNTEFSDLVDIFVFFLFVVSGGN